MIKPIEKITFSALKGFIYLCFDNFSNLFVERWSKTLQFDFAHGSDLHNIQQFPFHPTVLSSQSCLTT